MFIALACFATTTVAQTADPEIAYDQCWADACTWEIYCCIGTVVSGYDSILTDGTSPKWSKDRSRIVLLIMTCVAADDRRQHDHQSRCEQTAGMRWRHRGL